MCCGLRFYNVCCFFFFKQKTAYEMRISDWSSDVCSSDLLGTDRPPPPSPCKACIRACRSVSHASAGTEASRRSALPYHPLRLFLAPESAVPFDVLTLLWIAAVFLLGGTVKGVIGLGLPTIALGLFAATMDIRASMALQIGRAHV